MSTPTQHSYLIIADISGYTSFVAKTELEHSQEILSELLELMVSRFQPTMTISKLEGDAVFVYAPEEVFACSKTLIDFIESMYAAFRDRQLSMKRATTCTCKACRNIPSLDLKFFIHCGDYIRQTITNIRELVGSDVNLVHRLTKNHVTESTGWRAYMMFTEQCLNHNRLNLANAHVQMEAYESLGEIKTFNIDLHKRYKEICEARCIVLEEQDADFIFQIDFPTPPSVTWEWFHNPDKRNIWNGGHVTWSAGNRPHGRPGIGSSNHCAHGKSVITEVMVDWHPFEYYTAHSFKNGKQTYTETVRLEALPNGGTRIRDVHKVHMPIPRFIRSPMVKFVIITQYHYDKAMALAAKLANEEFTKTKDKRG
jgi:class 3 adenylate cyclase